MSGSNTEMPQFIASLRQQIDTLTQEQADALKRATYLGMTPDEAKVYDARRVKITELMGQFVEIRQAHAGQPAWRSTPPLSKGIKQHV